MPAALRPLLRPLLPLVSFVRTVLAALICSALASDGRLGLRLAERAWRSPAMVVRVVERAEPAVLERFVAARPERRRDDALAQLVAFASDPEQGPEDPHVRRGWLTRLAAESDNPALRRAVARQLAAADAELDALAVLQADPPVYLPVREYATLLREVRDPELVEPLLAWTTEQLAIDDNRQQVVRLHGEALLTLGKIAYAEHDDQRALELFERAHREAGPTVHTCTLTARALARAGRLEESRRLAEQALLERPDWVPALVHLGRLNRQFDRRAEAVACYRRALDEEHVSAFHLGRSLDDLLRLGEPELALVAADRLLALDPARPKSTASRAVALWQLRRFDEAAEVEAELAARDDAPGVLAHAHYLGRTRESFRAYERLLTVPEEQRDEGSGPELVHMLRRDGHLDLACELAGQLRTKRPDDGDLGVLAREVDGEWRVFSGDWRAPAGAVPGPVAGVAGRILHVVGRSVPYASSGYAVRTDHTVRAQRAAGIDARVVTQQGFPWDHGIEVETVEEVSGVPHHRLPFPPDLPWPPPLDQRLDHNVAALSALVEQLRPAALHAASDFRNGLIALEVGERHDLPVVYEMRGFWEDTWLAKRDGIGADTTAYRLRREREDEVARRAAHVVTLAPTMRDALVERGLDASRISLVPNAVDPAAFPPVARDRALAAELGLGPDEVVAGYISSLVAYEGIEVLIEAIARLRADGVAVRGLIVGDGESRGELERLAAARGLGADVVFTGRVPHERIGAYYELIDLFVVPRTNARVCRLVSPLKPYEAMAASRALVVSGTPVLRSIIEEGVTGVAYEPEDAASLAAQLAELIADPDRRAALGHVARQRVLAEHTWARNAERYLDVYRALGVVPAAAPA